MAGDLQLASQSSHIAYNRQTTQNLMTVIPNTDYDYLLFFEHIVTRIENTISTLYVRAVVGNLVDKFNDNPFQLLIVRNVD